MKKQTFLILFLLAFIVVGVVSFLDRVTTYVGKDGIQSNEVVGLQHEFIDYLYRKEALKLTKEQLMEASPVTDEEIEIYRTYYGTLQEQIDNIKAQYEGATGQELKVRDQKIEKIKANFSDDDMVREKLTTMKATAIENYLKERTSSLTGGSKIEHFNYTVTVDGETVAQKDSASKVLREMTQTFDGYTDTIYLTLSEYIPSAEESIDLHVEIPIDYKEARVSTALLDSIEGDANYSDEIEKFEWRKMAFYVLWFLTAVAIVIAVITRKVVVDNFKNHFNVKLPKFTKYVDIQVLIALCMAWLSVQLSNNVSYLIEEFIFSIFYSGNFRVHISKLIQIALILIFIAATIVVVANLWKRLSEQQFTKEQFLSRKFVEYVQQIFANRKIGTQMVLMLLVFSCAGFGLAVVMMQVGAIVVYIPLFILIVIPALFMFVRRYAYLAKIIDHTEKLANGQVTEPMKVRGTSTFAKHAKNLNALQEGVKSSVQAQAKSERLKTELITNVSHDLRTPLTSIITYTDLLKAEKLSDEERHKYVGILEKKSHRLKQLIEDLFEVSKMASGNIEIHRQQIDLAQLLQQIVAEHEEDYEKAGLALRMTIAEQPIFANVDAQKWWRVYDNLLVNARKYSLENSRVYISLKNEAHQAVFTIKNVTRYELGENVNELTERFKRGDASRNTEGSGLGLAIAQSIVDLHGGDMKIELHGDLFQVTVAISK